MSYRLASETVQVREPEDSRKTFKTMTAPKLDANSKPAPAPAPGEQQAPDEPKKRPRLLQKNIIKPWSVIALKYFILFIHMFTIVTYSLAIICEAIGVMTHSDPISLKTGYKTLDLLSVRFNPLMSEEKWFIAIVMFVGALLTTYDMTCVWADDFHLVTQGRFPEQMIFMFLVQMFAAMFLFSPKFLQKHWIRTGSYIAAWAIPRLLFTGKMGQLVKEEMRKLA